MNRIHQLLDPWLEKLPSALAYTDFDGAEFTFSQFGHAVDEAVQLLLDHEVRPGDRVSLVCENCVAAAALVLACSRCDAWVNLLNGRITSDEITKITDHAGSRVIIFTHQASQNALQHATFFSGEETRKFSFGRVMITEPRETETEPVYHSALEQVGALIYTTGTTGNPKGVMLTHDNLLAASQSSAHARDLSSRDNVYFILPMTHIYGFCSVFLTSLRVAAKIEFVPRFDPELFIAAMAHRISVAQGVPAHYAAILKYCVSNNIEILKAPKLRYCSAGGAPLDIAWKRKIESFLGQQLHNGYGMTEASPGISATIFGHPCDDDNVGFALLNVEIRLAPPPGSKTLKDGVGEILCRGRNIMKGYYKNPSATRDAIDGEGWLHTGDLGRFGDDGSLYVVGRSKELIIRSGFSVFPIEVETAMNSHPAVVQSAVVGRRLADGNEEVLGFAELRPKAKLGVDEFNDYLKERLAPYKRPAQIIFASSLPAASTGKLLKHKLIDTFAAELRNQAY